MILFFMILVIKKWVYIDSTTLLDLIAENAELNTFLVVPPKMILF